jgi:hypothetical protein
MSENQTTINETYTDKRGSITYPSRGDILVSKRDGSSTVIILNSSGNGVTCLEVSLKDMVGLSLPKTFSSLQKLRLHKFNSRQDLVHHFRTFGKEFPFNIMGRMEHDEVLRIINKVHDIEQKHEKETLFRADG